MGSSSQRLLRNQHTNRVLLIGDRFLLLDALRLALTREKLDVAIIGTDQRAIEEALAAFNPLVVIFEGSGISGERLARTVRWLKETERVVIGVVAERVSVDAAFIARAGANGVLGLDTGLDDLAAMVCRARSEEVAIAPDRRYVLEDLLREHRRSEENRWLPFQDLSPRERDIFALVYEGLSADQIAEDACVAVSTVRTHVRSILSKLNVHSQLAAVAMARSNQWFTADSLVESS
ncbi:MAG: response regulator transcription factor [Gemmatimonadetes bacterium]|nr:response regulator transcription factor [Gemmatimonadota bacterium]